MVDSRRHYCWAVYCIDRTDLAPELGPVERERERERACLDCVSPSGQSGVVQDHNNIKMSTLPLQAADIAGDVGGIIHSFHIKRTLILFSSFLAILGSEYCSGYIDEGTLIFSLSEV